MRLSVASFQKMIIFEFSASCKVERSQSSHPLTSGNTGLAGFAQTQIDLELPQLGDWLVRHRVLPYHDWQTRVPGREAVRNLLAQSVGCLGACRQDFGGQGARA